jgi:acetolactate synthase-1/2/3 large subunit
MEKLVSVARYLVYKVEELGIDCIPVFQGGAIMKLIDEIGQSKKIKYVCPNHEQALAMMVDGYARLKGFGVGVVTSGPGGTNLVTGIAGAYYDSIPCLFFTGQVGRFHLKRNRQVRQRGFQETDMIALMKPITKYSVLLDDPLKTRYIFEKAVYIAKSGRPGPVMIDLPYDVQRAIINPKLLIKFTPPKNPEYADNLKLEINNIIDDLKTHHKPLILIGGGIRLAKQIKGIRELIQRLKIPITASWAAADIFPSSYKYYIGTAGRNGNRSAVKAIQNCDYLLALGTKFPPTMIINEKKFAQQAKIVAVDIDKGELQDSLINIHQKIHCDLKYFIPNLLQRIKQSQFIITNKKEWLFTIANLKKNNYKIDITRNKNKKYVSPYKFLAKLSDILNSNAVITLDTGCNLTWVLQGYSAKIGQRLFSSWGLSPMGYSLPAALGAYYANKKLPIIALIGDGGLQINIQELQTMVFNKIPLKLFVFNNECYGNVKFGAAKEFAGRTHALEPKTGYQPPNFIKIAKAYKLKSIIIDGSKNLSIILKNILKLKEPMLVEVRIDPEQQPFYDPKI